MPAEDIGGRATAGVGIVAAGAVAAGAPGEPEERWPLPYTALLLTASSVVIWSLIIAAVRWVLG